jgi:integrase
MVEAYQRQRQQDALRPATINRERAVLSHVFTRAIGLGLIEHNPVAGTPPFPEANERPRPLSQDEEARLLTALPAHYHPWITLALHTGLRLGELRAQRWADVDMATGSLRVTKKV